MLSSKLILADQLQQQLLSDSNKAKIDQALLILSHPQNIPKFENVLEVSNHMSRVVGCILGLKSQIIFLNECYRNSSIKLQQLLQMFQNSYQNGTYFDLLDPKNSAQKLKLLYRTANVNANNKVFDKDLKTFVLQFTSPNSKIFLPKQDKKDLYLIQQFLVFQIFFFPGLSWNIELTISDLTKTKRRIILSPTTHKVEIKPFFVKIPCQNFTEGLWNNFAVDLYSFIEPFKGQTYRSLDSICISGHFKLRRIYTSTTQPLECEGENQSQQINQINFLPKNYYFPQGVQYSTKLNRYNLEHYEETVSEASQSTTIKQNVAHKNVKPKTGPSIPRPQKSIEVIKTQKLLKEKEVRYAPNIKKGDFLANTNGTQIINKKKKQEQISDVQLSSDNASNHIPNNSKSTDKTVKKKLTKTQEIPTKPRSSLQGYSVVPKKGGGKQSTKNKVNPWRNNKLKENGYTDSSHLQTSKQQDERKTETPQTTSMLKTKLNTGKHFTDTKHMGFDKRSSDHYSDNEYVELSQKFSTLTDGKFFKNELGNNFSNQIHQKNQEEQIQQNIEMQTNSVHSDHQKPQPKRAIQNVPIHESICDSLDRFNHQKIEEKLQKIGRSSLYGFGQQLMKRFMGQIERPYSPPIGERQVTQQQVSQNHNVKEQVELLFDPVLNCYYDPKTHTYYQLKS